MRIKETISADEVGKVEDVLPEFGQSAIKLKNRRMIGKYARWQCDRCGIEKEHPISMSGTYEGRKAILKEYGWKLLVFWHEDLVREDAEQFVLTTLQKEGII